MRDRSGRRCAVLVLTLVITATAWACRAAPSTPEERKARGLEVLTRMSQTLSGANLVSLATTETIERVEGGQKRVLHISRQVRLRRPDRLWFKMEGDRQLEAFYAGRQLTLIAHGHKVFGRLPTPPTLDETVDLVSERYGIPLPIGDLLTANPHGTLTSRETTGGWSRREQAGNVECDLLSWQHPAVDWSIWIPATGDPLPRKLTITAKARPQQPSTTVLFTSWDLHPTDITDAAFDPRIPADYEGVPVVQRAAALAHADQQEVKP